MTTEKTTAELIASALRERIASRNSPVRFGILAQNLPPFDVQTLYTKLIEGIPDAQAMFRLALIGFDDNAFPEGVATMAEQAVEWRNDPSMTVPLIVILNPQRVIEIEKIHSLELLEPFEDTQLQRAICKTGRKQSKTHPNATQVELLWDVLCKKSSGLRIPIVTAQLAAFYEAIQSQEHPGTAIVQLGLLPDPALDKHMQDRDTLKKRLKSNYERVLDLLALDKGAYRALAAGLKKDATTHQDTFVKVQAYTQKPSITTLSKLTYDAVVALWKAKDESVNQPQTDKPARKRKESQEPQIDTILIERFLDRAPLEPELQDMLVNEFEHVREDPSNDQPPAHEDDVYPYEAVIDGYELTARRPDEAATDDKNKRHPLENWMRQWVQTDRWGGIIQSKAFSGSSEQNDASSKSSKQGVSLVEMLEAATELSFTPFQPLDKQHPPDAPERISLLSLFEALDKALEQTEDGDKLANLLTTLHQKRSRLAAYRISLLYYPMHVIAIEDKRTLLVDYIQAYEHLAQCLQSVCLQATKQFPDTVEQALAQFLALDTVIINRKGNEAALLTSLHPLHVWKWYELARRRDASTETWSDAEKAMLTTRIKNLPTQLNTLLLHTHMFFSSRHVSETHLVIADTIQSKSDDVTMGIPLYQPIAKQQPSREGFDHITKLLEQFLALYPPARIGLVMTIIDPPPTTLSTVLKACHTLSQDAILHGASIQVYRTNTQVEAYDIWSRRDDDVLELFYDNPHWTFNVDIAHTSYGAIAEHIQQRAKQHIIILSDPSDAVALLTLQTARATPGPFDVPMHITYDRIRDNVRIATAPVGGLFESYTNIRSSLTGELYQRTVGVSSRSAIEKTELEQLAAASYWLIVIDRLHSTLEMPTVGQRIAWKPVGTRTLSVWTQDKQRWQEHFADADLDVAHIDNYLTVFPDGLLTTLVKLVPSAAADETRHEQQTSEKTTVFRLRAIMTILQWHRQKNPLSVLLNIDPQHTDQFIDWFGQDVPQKHDQTYVLAVQYDDQAQTLLFDVVAVQAFDSDEPMTPLPDSKEVLKPLQTFARTLETLFASDAEKTVLAPIRRELLRVSLSTAVFTPPYSQQETATIQHEQKKHLKAEWERIINAMFQESHFGFKVQCLRHVRVYMQSTDSIEHTHSVDHDHDHDHTPFNMEIVDLSVASVSPSASVHVEPPESASAAAPSPIEVAKSASAPTPAPVEPPVEEKVEENRISDPEATTQKPAHVQHDITKQAAQLRRVLMDYGIAVAKIDEERTQVGPRIIRYWVKLQPPAGRLSEIQKYAEDIARELESRSVPLIDNIPGERYVGIDLPRHEPEIKPLDPALNTLPDNQRNTLMFAVGVDMAGNAIQQDLVRLPHMLVAGTTGSGKTMFLTTLIMSLVWRHIADELELLLIDPKETDFVIFQNLPHLRENRIFYDPEESISVLQNLTGDERDRRTSLLRSANCRNILEYNRRNPQQRLSWIVIVVDEFADIMLTLSRTERANFERQISRLAATGRNIGVHLVLATQRPTTDVVTGTIKANIPARISFRLPSNTDSRTILDRSGAERLLGQGDMLALFEAETQRLQGYFASFDDMDHLLNCLLAT